MKSERLQLKFKDENEKDFSISFADFKENISKEELDSITADIIDSKTLSSKDALAKEFKEANIITITVQPVQ